MLELGQGEEGGGSLDSEISCTDILGQIKSPLPKNVHASTPVLWISDFLFQILLKAQNLKETRKNYVTPTWIRIRDIEFSQKFSDPCGSGSTMLQYPTAAYTYIIFCSYFRAFLALSFSSTCISFSFFLPALLIYYFVGTLLGTFLVFLIVSLQRHEVPLRTKTTK